MGRRKLSDGEKEDMLFLKSEEGLPDEEIYTENDICENCYEQPETCTRTMKDKFLCWVGTRNKGAED